MWVSVEAQNCVIGDIQLPIFILVSHSDEAEEVRDVLVGVLGVQGCIFFVL